MHEHFGGMVYILQIKFFEILSYNHAKGIVSKSPVLS